MTHIEYFVGTVGNVTKLIIESSLAIFSIGINN